MAEQLANRLSEAHGVARTDFSDKSERARAFVRDAKLGTLIPRLFERTRHWPSWAKQEPRKWTVPEGVADIEGDRQGGTFDKQWVSYRWKNHKWELSIDKRGYDSAGTQTADFSLTADGDLVLVLKANMPRLFTTFESDDVRAITVGAWVDEISDMVCAFDDARTAINLVWATEGLKAQADKLKLD